MQLGYTGRNCTLDDVKKEVKNIRFLFWNINKKNLVQEVIESSLENEIDIIMLAEAENLDSQYLLGKMGKHGRPFAKKVVNPENEGILLFASVTAKVSVYKEFEHLCAYKIRDEKKNYLLVVLHLKSAMYKDESARTKSAINTCRVIDKLEESCNREAQTAREGSYSTIVVGDFNLQPFSDGVISSHGFNAVMDAGIARKIRRIVDREEARFYYNPMWHLMGNHNGIPGTYYSHSDQADKSFYWYTYDQILLRPELIDHFVWEEFMIVEQIGTSNLIQSGKINKKRYSDHLPVKFEIR